MVKQFFQVIILPKKLCFVYLIKAERNAFGEMSDSSLFIRIGFFFFANVLTVRNCRDKT